jgi:drug/metabolite transporter (DMT)-like permease
VNTDIERIGLVAPAHAAPTCRASLATSPRLATILGLGAILLWSTLATLTGLKGSAMRPFQTTAITFAIGGLLLLSLAIIRGRRSALKPNAHAFVLGVYGLFVFHALYFASLRLAPAAEASLIASLWALFTVLLSALLPGHRLQPRHVIGAMIGLAASVLLVGGGGVDELTADRDLGLALALGCALVWASYSVLSRLIASVPSESLALPCLATAGLALLCNLLFEGWVWPTAGLTWLALGLLGLGPVGGAFLLWDIGMKHGNIALLGVLAYASPVMSTCLLVAVGFAVPSVSLAVACAMMMLAAVVAVERP